MAIPITNMKYLPWHILEPAAEELSGLLEIY